MEVEVKNGVCASNELQARFADIVSLIEYISSEETAEGQDQAIPDALRDGLLALKPAIKAYAEAQLDEALPDSPPAPPAAPSDYDVLDEDAEVANADDAPEAGADAAADAAPADKADSEAPKEDAAPADKADSSKASLDAHKATVQAHVSGSADDHAAAAKAHADAGKAQEADGHKKMAAHHAAQAAYHQSAADAAPAPKGDASDAAEPVDNAKDAPAECDAPVKNSAGISIELSASIQDGLAKVMARLEALESKISLPIQNSAKPSTLIVGNTKVVTREMDADEVIQNGATDIDAEARRIASLPRDKQGAALIAYQLAKHNIH